MNNSDWEEDLGAQNLRLALIRIIKKVGTIQAQLGSHGHALSQLQAEKLASSSHKTEMLTEPQKLQIPIGWLVAGMIGASLAGGLLSWILIRVAPPSELGRINGRVNNMEIRMQRLERKLNQ
ncbi:hypothetical protein [Lyngbya aestuarii]|uniref:hypothetical protein n=1 Tax=Lyngbya aestuarii TaxID=118322 RepID=UPI00403E1C07